MASPTTTTPEGRKSAMMEGVCNCGAIKIQFKRKLFPEFSGLCHCLNCRTSSGGLASVNFSISSNEISIIKGEPKVYHDKDTISGHTTDRKFCGDCGTAILSIVSECPETAYVKGGLFVKNKEPLPHVGVEVFWSRAEEWEVKTDGAQIFD